MKNLFTSLFFLTAISSVVLSQRSDEKKNTLLGTIASQKFSPMDGSASLGLTYSDSACGLNYVQASQLVQTRTQPFNFNMNGTGLPTTLSISGLPASYSVVKAYVWYLASYQSATVPSTAVTITNPNMQAYTNSASLIGTDIALCWGEVGSAAYRTDVTSNISGNGNYVVDIAGFSNPNWEVDGITLFIVYKDLTATYNGSIVIYDGIRGGVGNTFTDTITNLNVCANSTSASGFVIVADMQENVNGNSHPSTINGATANYANNFWNFNTASTSVIQGQTTAAFGVDGLTADCFGWMAMGLYYQTNCASCCTSLVVSASSSGSGCTSNGSATATPNCGTSPFTYLWSNGQSTQTATGLAAGTYTVTVTDSTLTTATATVSVSNTPFIATATATAVSCFGGNNGTGTVNVAGGTAPYTYLWNPTGQATQTATGLITGMHSVIVSDAGGCVDTFSVAVTGAPMLVMSLNSTPSSCSTCPDGSAVSNVFGGTPSYSYLWSSGQTTPNITGLFPGNYTLCVTDANNCTTCDSVSVSGVGINETVQHISIIISPNPFSEFTTLQITTPGINNCELMIYDLFGKEANAVVTQVQNKFIIQKNNLNKGIYFYRIESEGKILSIGKLLVQ